MTVGLSLDMRKSADGIKQVAGPKLRRLPANARISQIEGRHLNSLNTFPKTTAENDYSSVETTDGLGQCILADVFDGERGLWPQEWVSP